MLALWVLHGYIYYSLLWIINRCLGKAIAVVPLLYTYDIFGMQVCSWLYIYLWRKPLQSQSYSSVVNSGRGSTREARWYLQSLDIFTIKPIKYQSNAPPGSNPQADGKFCTNGIKSDLSSPKPFPKWCNHQARMERTTRKMSNQYRVKRQALLSIFHRSLYTLQIRTIWRRKREFPSERSISGIDDHTKANLNARR